VLPLHHQAAIPNFSTQPSWLYGPDDKANLTALGDYYGRLLAWYTKGGVKDECGVYHHSGHSYNITIWEVFNEPIAEHHHTVESYTLEYDAVVNGIRKWADQSKKIKFVGMNLANIRTAAEVQQWATYFLNASNHAIGSRDSLDYIAYHSYPTNRGSYTTDPSSMSALFDYYDSFIKEVNDTAHIASSLSQGRTGTILDECGTTKLPAFRNTSDPTSGNLYFVASGAGFVFLYLRVAALRGVALPVVGMSQLMDDVSREPGVTMLDWTNGNGTARYWALRLVREAVAPGDRFVPTNTRTATRTTTTTTTDTGVSSSSLSPSVYAQGVITAGGDRRVVLVNKQYATTAVAVEGCSHALVVDTESGEGPPREVPCGSGGSVDLGPFASAVVYTAVIMPTSIRRP